MELNDIGIPSYLPNVESRIINLQRNCSTAECDVYLSWDLSTFEWNTKFNKIFSYLLIKPFWKQLVSYYLSLQANTINEHYNLVRWLFVLWDRYVHFWIESCCPQFWNKSRFAQTNLCHEYLELWCFTTCRTHCLKQGLNVDIR